MLIKRETFRTRLKSVAKVLWKVLCFVIFITTIALLSKYTSDAFKLRHWRNETNSHIPIFNSIIPKFRAFLSSNSSPNNPLNTNLNISQVFYEEESNNNPQMNNNFGWEAENEEDETTTEVTPRICKPEPPKDDFSKCGNRVADRKCCEYIWSLKYKDVLLDRYKCFSDYGILDGSLAATGEFPHMAAVGYKVKNQYVIRKPYVDQHVIRCGGSLISERYVLSAAHCTFVPKNDECESKPDIVRLGSAKLSEHTDSFKYKIEGIISHRKYKSPLRYYDIALLKLQRNVIFRYGIHPACLSTELKDPSYDKKVNVTGWGVIKYGTSKMSDDLLRATIKIISRSECDEKTNSFRSRNFRQLRYHQLCAGTDGGGVDTCQGDSGGPMQVRINTTSGFIHRVMGVTSFGQNCGVINKPAIYTKVSTVLTWIEKTVWAEYENNIYEGFSLQF